MKKFPTIILAALSLAACDDNDPAPTSAGSVKISPVADIEFSAGDRIGLSITKTGGPAYVDNSALIYVGGVFSGNLEWYPTGESASLTACYSYSEGGFPNIFTIAADQSSTGYRASNLMIATKEEVQPTAGAVSMVFTRMLSKIAINADNGSGSDISSIRIKGTKPTADINTTTLAVAAEGTAADITAHRITANTAYGAIVVPQTAAITLEVTLSDNSAHSQTLQPITLEQGVEYVFNIQVWDGKIEVTQEYEDRIVYGGATYNTATLSNGATWMTTPLRYIPEGYTPSSDPAADSHIWYPYTIAGGNTVAATDADAIAANGYLYDYEAALGGEINQTNCYDFEGVQGICPMGWHIPTWNDYFALCGYSNRPTGDDDARTDPDALFYDATYVGGKIGLFNAGGFNYVFSGIRMKSNFAAAAAYQKTVTTASNCTVAEWIGLPSLSYYMTSTAFGPIRNTGGELTNIQFFSLMSTFTGTYPEGKLTLAYAGIKSGLQVRCVKDAKKQPV